MEHYTKMAPIGLLSTFILKQLILGTSVSEMGVTFALTSAVIAYEYLSRSRKVADLESILTKKVETQDAVIKKQNEVIEAMATEVAKVRNSLDGVRAAQGGGPIVGLKRNI